MNLLTRIAKWVNLNIYLRFFTVKRAENINTYAKELWLITLNEKFLEMIASQRRLKFKTPHTPPTLPEEAALKKLQILLRHQLRVTDLKKVKRFSDVPSELAVLELIYGDKRPLLPQKTLAELLVQAFGQAHLDYAQAATFGDLEQSKQQMCFKIAPLQELLKKEGFDLRVNLHTNDQIQIEIIQMESQWHEILKKDLYEKIPANRYGQTKEFLQKAADFYAKGDHGESVVNANKALETCLKCMCQRHNLIGAEATNVPVAKLLVAINTGLLKKILFKDHKSLNLLVDAMTCGLPSLRNEAAHGADLNGKHIQRSFAKIALNLALSYIHFLVEIDKQYPEEFPVSADASVAP